MPPPSPKQINLILKIEETNLFNNVEEKNLPDGKTYIYEGKNKEKIETLLRELHPETAKVENKVAEKTESYILNENKNDNSIISSKFNLIRQNLGKLDSVEEKEESEIIDFFAEQTKENNIDDILNNNVERIENEEKNENELNQNNDEIDTKDVTQQTIQINQETKVFETIKEENNEEKTNIVNKENNNGNFNTMYEKLFGTKVINDLEEKQKEEENLQIKKISAIDIVNSNVSMFEGIEKYNKPTFKIIGLVFETYIIAEIEKEMYIINEKVAREKLLFDYLRNNYNIQNSKDSQMLLLPDVINLTEKEMEIAKENFPMFRRAGFVLEEFGQNTIKLSGVPNVCIQLNTRELIYKVLDEINTVARIDSKEKENKFLEVVTSNVVEKQNRITNIQEANELMDKLLCLEEPFKYFEDKQVALKMTKYDIERKFSRK